MPDRLAAKDVLTAEEAAEYLAVSVKTIRQLARAGRLPGRHVGKEWRFSRKALLDWLAESSSEDDRRRYAKGSTGNGRRDS
ncbi:MAG: helix-turn-helix domain-containing protein [Actinomycetota bacterium]|nr:helix-turn-helix domain-containing protein [Actinomycetota bacterium]